MQHHVALAASAVEQISGEQRELARVRSKRALCCDVCVASSLESALACRLHRVGESEVDHVAGSSAIDTVYIGAHGGWRSPNALRRSHGQLGTCPETVTWQRAL